MMDRIFRFIGWKPQLIRYKLGPGATLATFVRHRVKSAELAGYNYIYCALVFFPAGALLGIAARQASRNWFARLWDFRASFILMIPIVLEFLLVAVSGRAFSLAALPLSISLMIAWHAVDQRRSSAPTKRDRRVAGNCKCEVFPYAIERTSEWA